MSSVSFDLVRGEIAGLIGPNGAGKSTFINAVTGFERATGSVRFDGRDINGLRPHQRCRAGLTRTFQSLELFDDLSVEENVAAGLAGLATPLRTDAVDATLDLLGLTGRRDFLARELSQGERQLVAIGRALVCRPACLLLDEPAAGLDPTDGIWLASRLRAVRDTGVALLVVDHNMGFLMDLCDRIHVLDFGQLIASGTPGEVQCDQAVRDAYLGDLGFDAQLQEGALD